MNFLPIVHRELRVASRRRSTHLIRVWVSLLALVGLLSLLMFSVVPGAERGRQLYMLVSALALCYALVAGVVFTAAAINEERTRGTLGLLFLTDLHPRDILLGKLAATSLNGSYVLVSLIPVLAMPIAFGGVPLWQVCSHSLLLLVTLVLSLSVGLHVSVRYAEPGVAIVRGLMLMGMIVILPLLFFGFGRRSVSLLSMIGPLNAYLALVSSRWSVLPTGHLLAAVALIGSLAFLFFRAAVKGLRPGETMDSSSVSESPRPPNAWEFSVFGGAHSDADRPPRAGSQTRMFGQAGLPPDELLETDPIKWLLWRRNRFPRPDRFFLLSVLAIGLPMSMAAFAGAYWWLPVLLMAFVLHMIAVSHMASQSCKRISSEDDRAALELLITTPRGARGTLESYHQAFKQLFQTQFWWLAGLHLALIMGALSTASGLAPIWALWPAVALLVLFAERFAISWVGFNQSLRHGRYHRALGGVQLWVMLPVWGYVVVFLVMFPLRILGHRHWWVGYAGWLFVGCLLPLVAGLWNRSQAERWMRDHGSLFATN